MAVGVKGQGILVDSGGASAVATSAELGTGRASPATPAAGPAAFGAASAVAETGTVNGGETGTSGDLPGVLGAIGARALSGPASPGERPGGTLRVSAS